MLAIENSGSAAHSARHTYLLEVLAELFWWHANVDSPRLNVLCDSLLQRLGNHSDFVPEVDPSSWTMSAPAPSRCCSLRSTHFLFGVCA